MLVDEQYRYIEPDTITEALAKRGWKNHGTLDFEGSEADVWKKGALVILIQDGDQRDALSAVFDYEGPACVSEIWEKSGGAVKRIRPVLEAALSVPGMYVTSPESLATFCYALLMTLPCEHDELRRVWQDAAVRVLKHTRCCAEPAWNMLGMELTAAVVRAAAERLEVL